MIRPYRGKGNHWLLSTSTCYKYLVVTNAPQLLDRLRAKRAQAYQGDLFDPECPTRLVLDRISDKWTALVVLLLSDGPMRFSELRGHIGRVAPKVLTQTLRRMERDGLITREIFAEVPPRVEYALTGLGHSLIEPIALIGDWAEIHVDQITKAQAAYDAARQL
ncbi:helix-turn-helix transcriptional regulator [Streptosporangiaceae bacterium NEAU-GS5]|nr:helix-turn-helix transcriptional regulator [Streptosporangiaceae bacterium NEAU-GS5]